MTEDEIEEILAEGDPAERISGTEAAKRAGMTPHAVTRYLQRRPGLRGPDGLVDAAQMAEALATLKASTKSQAQPKTQPGRRGVKPKPVSAEIVAASNAKLQADARKAEASAQRQEIAARRDAGELLDRGAVLHLNRQIISAARNRLASIPDQMADTLAHLDADQINTLLTAEIEAVLKELARLTLQYERPSPPMGGR